jgi:hypothetical protein
MTPPPDDPDDTGNPYTELPATVPSDVTPSMPDLLRYTRWTWTPLRPETNPSAD